MNFDQEYQKLNPAQKEAVDTIYGPVMVVAGPGTGKTQILSLRIANLLNQTDINPENILALTFTESGVISMRKRLEKMIGYHAYQVNISTFHSFATSVIYDNPDKFAWKRELETLSDLKKIRLFDNINTKNANKLELLRPFNAPDLYKSAIISAISNIKREGVSIEEFEEAIKISKLRIEESSSEKKLTESKINNLKKELQKQEELLLIYREYQNYLKNNSLYDYEDMINFVVEKLESEPDLLLDYQERYQFIMVDEFQDTNGAQSKIVEKLCNYDNKPNIFAVGDDDQSIYRFQGASMENILEFESKYKDVKTIPITTSYRSTKEVLNTAMSLIEKNEQRLVRKIEGLNKSLTAYENKSGPKTELYEFSTQEVEKFFVVEKIKELANKGVSYKDIAIIFRKNKESEELIDLFERTEIPYKYSQSGNLLKKDLIIQIIKLLETIDNVESDYCLYEILNFDFFDIKSLDLYKISTKLRKSKSSLIDILLDIEKLNKYEIENILELNGIATKIIELKKQESNMPFITYVERILQDLGIVSFFLKQNSLEKIHEITSFLNFVKRMNQEEPGLNLSKFNQNLKLMSENFLYVKETPFASSDDSVSLLTAHSSKGLEYEHVFIIGLTENNWEKQRKPLEIQLPNFGNYNEIESKNSNTNIEDERRLLFVAITRAKNNIYMSYPKQIISTTSAKDISRSRFISEIDEEHLTHSDTSKYEKEVKARLELELTKKKEEENTHFNKEEEAYLKELVDKFVMSPSSLNAYLKDPQDFLYNYLLKIPKPKIKPLYLGTATHYALEKFFSKYDENNENVEILLSEFETALLKENLEKNEFQEALNEGKQILESYYENNKDTFIHPLALEYAFFRQNIYLDDIKIHGVIDKIELIENVPNGKPKVRVIDYKTSRPKTRGQIEGTTQDSIGEILNQMTFYKLLSELDPKFPYKVEEVQIDFLRPDNNGKYKKETYKSDELPIDDLKEKVKYVMAKIRNLEFEPNIS